MSIEQKINYQLNKHPALKRKVKRVYQRVCCLFSKKVRSEGDIRRLSPKDGKEYFFGYYDKSPWDASGRYILCMQADDTRRDVSPRSPLNILLLDAENGYAPTKIAFSSAWNVQMGCMAQWLGPGFDREIVYNDCRNGSLCAVIRNVFTDEERVLPRPVYAVSEDGKTALTLDFARLYNLRPGYGYYNEKETTEGVALPDTFCIWKMDMVDGVVAPLLKYTDLAAFQPRKEMLEPGVVHKVNHIMIAPGGRRFMFLYRWFVGGRKYTRLMTCNTDGSDLYVLNDDDMVSHCFWKNDDEIVAFENKKDGGPGYYLMRDKTQTYRRLLPACDQDGHPSYAPDRSLLVTDSYPDRRRMQEITILRDTEPNGAVIARVFAPFRYDNDTRCDLHPRWSRDGRQICFDACFEGVRELYAVEVNAPCPTTLS